MHARYETVERLPTFAKAFMPAILEPEDWAAWLGETAASRADVKAVLRTFEDNGNWIMSEKEPTRAMKKPRKPGPQPGLF